MGTARISAADLWWKSQKKPLKCYYCGKNPLSRSVPMGNKYRATIDHLIPMGKGGTAAYIDNAVVACQRCNEDKGALLPDEYAVVVEYRLKKNAGKEID